MTVASAPEVEAMLQRRAEQPAGRWVGVRSQGAVEVTVSCRRSRTSTPRSASPRKLHRWATFSCQQAAQASHGQLPQYASLAAHGIQGLHDLV